MHMRHIISGVFALSLVTGSSSYCRADDQKPDAPASAGMATSGGPGQDAGKPDSADAKKSTDAKANGAAARTAEGPDAQAKARLDNFRQKHEDNPYTDKVAVAAQDLAKTLDDDQAQTFAQIRDGSGIMRTVRVTVGEVGNAVAMCGDKNADLKKPMDERFSSWKKDVDAALDKNGRAMDADVKAGVAGDPNKVASYLKLLDEWSAYNESKIEKKPVTTEGACKTLLSTMDKSGPAIVSQLESIKWPEPTPKAKEGAVKNHAKSGGKQPDQTEPAAGKTR